MTQTAPRSREWDSAAYHRISGPQFSWGQKVLARLALAGHETVLDAGCGTGRLTGELLEQLPSGAVVAVDLSGNMLAKARENLQAKFGARARYVAADLQDLPFGQSFDGIFSTASFHWIPDHERLFRSLFSALRPGAWLCAQCGGANNLARLLGRLEELLKTPRFSPCFAGFRSPWMYSSAEKAAQRLREAGFVEVETWLEETPTPFPSGDAFSEFIAKVVLHRHLERIPEVEDKARLLEELTKLAARDDPPFVLDYRRLNMNARRP